MLEFFSLSPLATPPTLRVCCLLISIKTYDMWKYAQQTQTAAQTATTNCSCCRRFSWLTLLCFAHTQLQQFQLWSVIQFIAANKNKSNAHAHTHTHSASWMWRKVWEPESRQLICAHCEEGSWAGAWKYAIKFANSFKGSCVRKSEQAITISILYTVCTYGWSLGKPLPIYIKQLF